MKHYVFGMLLGLAFAGTSPVIAQSQETSSPAIQPKIDEAKTTTGAVTTPADVRTEGKVTLWGIELDKGSLALPESGILSLKEALRRVNYHPPLLVGTRPKFFVYHGQQKQEVRFPALADGQPEVLLRDGDYVLATMELLDHATVLGHVKAGDNFYFATDEHPNLAQLVQLAGGLTGESANDAVTIIHTNFFRDANDKLTLSYSVVDHFEATLDPADPRWQRKMEHYDSVYVYSKSLKPDQLCPRVNSQSAQ